MAEIEHIMGWPAEEFAVQLRHAGDELPEVCALQKDYVRFAADTIDTLRHQIAQSQAEVGALRGLVKLGMSAVKASYSQALAEFHGHDQTADKLDKAVAEWRTLARAALAPHDGSR